MNGLFHWHIPKTAGTALRFWFAAQCGQENVSPGLSECSLHDALLRWPDRKVISGHFHAHQGDELPKDRWSLVVLRDPVQRFLSDFRFWQNNSDVRLLNAKDRLTDLDEHIERFAAGEPGKAALQVDMLYPLGTMSESRLGPEERLTAAMRAVDRFEMVGVQESLEDFACMIAARMGWSSREVSRENMTVRRTGQSEPESRQLEKIAGLLEAEIKLYEYARQRFESDRRRAINAPTGNSTDAALFVRTTGDDNGRATARDFGDRRAEIVQVGVRGVISGGSEVMCGEAIIVEIVFDAHVRLDELTVGFTIRDEQDSILFGTNSLLLGNAYQVESGTYVAHFTLMNRLGLGHYRVDASLIRELSHHDGCYHWLEEATRFEVCDTANSFFEGRFMLDPDFNLIAAADGLTVPRRKVALARAAARSFGRVNEPLTQFAAIIELLFALDVLPAGADSILQLRVKNSGQQKWPAGGRAASVCLSYRWLSSAGDVLVADGLRSMLPEDVTGGQAVIVPLLVRAPDKPGRYQLLISLVQESVAWFVEVNPGSALLVHLEIA